MNSNKYYVLGDETNQTKYITKAADVEALEIDESDLKKINKYSLVPLKSEDVFVFKATFADNEQDDRNDMPFDEKALNDLKKLYPGKTLLKDHNQTADNQIGRVFDTELVRNERKTTALGETYTELVGKIYMVKTDSNADLIKEIQGGVKKEVSTSVVPEKMLCNICGEDNLKNMCNHYAGYDYEVTDAFGNTTTKRCKMLLHGATEAYELSLVAIPAQPRAGARKAAALTESSQQAKEAAKLKIKAAEKFIFINDNK